MSQCSPILHTQGVMNVPFKMVLKVKQRPTLCHSVDYTVHGILQGQNTGVGSLSFLQGVFPTQVSHIAGRFFTSCATRETQA